MSGTWRLTPNPAEFRTAPVLGGDAAKIISGDPNTRTGVQFTGEVFMSGTWDCNVGKWNHTQGKDEFIHLLEGEMILDDNNGTVATYSHGETFLIPKGWDGTWEVTKTLKKFFVLPK